MRTTIIALATALAVAAPLAAQDEPRFEEKVDVNLVQLDVTVTDKKGNQILGLEKGDFVVRENGKPVEVDSMDYFTNRRLLDAPESQAAFKAEQVREERYFVIMFHTIPDAEARNAMQNQIQRARRAAIEFVNNQIKEQDRVAIVGHDIRLKIYSDFSSDPKALVKAIDEVVTFSNGITTKPESPVENGILANISMNEVINRTGRVYDSIRILADAVDPIPARKVLVLFSPGIGEPSSFNARLPENDKVWFDPMMVAIQKANVTVYPMHLFPNASMHASESNLVIMANETGGEYFRQATSFEMPLKIVENQNNGYYMLSYYAAADQSVKPVSIEVKLTNPEFVVKSRRAR
jgi:VWFA-related protein